MIDICRRPADAVGCRRPLQRKDVSRWAVDAEEEAEKIPMGFNSEEGLTEMDKNGNVTDGVRVEVMELKPVIIKKAAEERTRGEGQSLFGKMIKCDDFIDIFHRERFTERGAPVDKILVLQQPLEN
jgi:hypothetical protein